MTTVLAQPLSFITLFIIGKEITMPDKRISKGTLSMFLRTKCERALYLSLHKDSELAANSMPERLVARPGIGMLKDAGIEFESERNNQLIKIFNSSVIFKLGANSGPISSPLAALLNRVTVTPSFILQGKIEPAEFQEMALVNMGLSSSQLRLIPQIAGLIPDIIIVREPILDDTEITVTGERKPIVLETEKRRALSVLDVKHTSEANPSYSAEVAFYALFLANWLIKEGLQDRYYVTSKGYLWTRFKQGASELDRYWRTSETGETVTAQQYLDALILDCEDANLRFYLSTVLHFFREDLPKVITIGDASLGGWSDLEWHVDSRCSSCDWLGHDKWASASDKIKINASPNHYCYPAAKLNGHLSQIAGMTRGARKTLEINSIINISGAATATAIHPALQQHSHLKKERTRIPSRAQALLNATTVIDTTAVLATLAKAPNLHAVVAVNFDASAGLLTGLSLSGRVTNYIKGEPPQSFGVTSFIVDQKDFDNEWVALEGFLSKFSDIIIQSEAFVSSNNKKLTAQIAFWERRQFEELCAAMGRHLPKILSLTDRKTKALAWLFPADELIEKPDGAVSPCVVFIDEIIRRVVFSPTPHVITLFDTSENYFSGTYSIKQSDPYYREFLANGIPRERIYEIWNTLPTGSVTRGRNSIPRNTAIQHFGNALDLQCRALNSVTEKLRSDFKHHLKASAPHLSLTIPPGANKVAFDSKLWIWWDELQYHTNRLEAHQQLALDAETLEANYEAIRLTNGHPTNNQNEFIFDVLEGSTEVKLDDNDGFLAVGKAGFPGFPLQRGQDIIDPTAPPYISKNPHANPLYNPLWSSLVAHLIEFDRNNLKATISFDNWHEPDFIPYLLKYSSFDLMNDIFITKGQVLFRWYEKTRKILLDVGNPAIAKADKNALKALGQAPKLSNKSSAKINADAITPLAQVLWDAYVIHQKSIIPSIKAEAIADYATKKHNLNLSQKEAVIHAVEKGLTIIWGPPGTGKTQTLAGCIQGLIHDAVQTQQGLKILVAGPTYKAVEELIGRTVQSLDQDDSCAAEIYVAYSASRVPLRFPATKPHLKVKSFNLSHSANQAINDCLDSLVSSSSITVVATATMQAYKLADWLFDKSVGPVFDVVIIDESSQVPVTTAISPIATLKDDFRLIIAGDHLQMPPIMALEPPVGAEYLVGSIQNYIFKRDFGGKIELSALKENYRSAEDIVAYARTIGYEQTLKAENPQTALHFLEAFPNPSNGFPQTLPWSDLWVTALEPDKKVLTILHEDDLSSQSNLYEAKIVAALVWNLKCTVSAKLDGRNITTHHAIPTEQEFWGECVGIVTPHRAQRALVIRELKEIFPYDDPGLIDAAVDTVEKFQGGQRHAIIITFGIGDVDVIVGEEAFLMQLERTNVAVSRAMAKCIVIMPMTLAGHVPQDKKALETAHALKGYVEEFCSAEIDGEILFESTSRRAKLRYY